MEKTKYLKLLTLTITFTTLTAPLIAERKVPSRSTIIDEQPEEIFSRMVSERDQWIYVASMMPKKSTFKSLMNSNATLAASTIACTGALLSTYELTENGTLQNPIAVLRSLLQNSSKSSRELATLGALAIWSTALILNSTLNMSSNYSQRKQSVKLLVTAPRDMVPEAVQQIIDDYTLDQNESLLIYRVNNALETYFKLQSILQSIMG